MPAEPRPKSAKPHPILTVVYCASALLVALLAAGLAWMAWPKPKAEFPTPVAPLAKYVSDLGYRPVPVPRDRWGPGTVVKLAPGVENIFPYFNENCLRLDVPPFTEAAKRTPDVDIANVSLVQSDFAYGRISSGGEDMNLSKLVAGKLDLGAQFKLSDDERVVISIPHARAFATDAGTVNAHVKAAEKGGLDCVGDLNLPDHFIIYEVLVVGDSVVRLSSQRSLLLKVLGSGLGKLKGSESLGDQLRAGSSLVMPTDRIIGYKVMQLTATPGIAKTTVTLRKLSLKELNQLVDGPPPTESHTAQ